MKKALVVLKWVLLTVPMGAFGIITAPFMYPLYDVFKWKFLWIYDDSNRILEDGSFEEDYRIFLVRRNGEEKESFKARYEWMGFRNTIWNFRVWLDAKQVGDGSGMTGQELVIDDLVLDGEKVSDGGYYDGGYYAQVAGLKYVVEHGQDPWQGWVGDEIDYRYSIIGESLMWFKQDGILSFRYSRCKPLFGKWFSIKITCIKTDVTLHLKLSKQ